MIRTWVEDSTVKRIQDRNRIHRARLFWSRRLFPTADL